MGTPSLVFTPDEAIDLIGTHVRLMKNMGRFPAGLTGRITSLHPYRRGYVIEVEWDGCPALSMMTFEYFTKDDFDEYLIEC